MGREKADYRENIAQLNRLFPEKEMLSCKDVMQVYGYKSETSVRNHVKLERGKISKVRLAKIMSE